MTALTLNLSSLVANSIDTELEALSRDNPDRKQVEIYCQGQNKEVLDNPQTLLGEDVLPKLVVSLEEIFN